MPSAFAFAMISFGDRLACARTNPALLVVVVAGAALFAAGAFLAAGALPFAFARARTAETSCLLNLRPAPLALATTSAAERLAGCERMKSDLLGVFLAAMFGYSLLEKV